MEAPPSRAPRAVLFDAYGTLFDVYSVGVVAERLFPGMGERLGVLWRDKQIEYTRLTSMSGQARSFRDCTRAGLRYAARRFDLGLDDAAERELMGAYERLSPFAENHAVLVELRRRGVRAGVLSNGDPDMLEAVVRHAGFAELLDPVLSVEGTGPVQDRPGDLRARHARARPRRRRGALRLEQLLGRDRRDLVRLHDTLDQPLRPAPRRARRAADADRHAAHRRARLLRLPRTFTMTLTLPAGMAINAPILPGFETVLTPPALALVAKLHRAFEPRRKELLAARVERAKRLDAGERPDFLASTAAIRAGDWKIAPVPPALHCRRVEITGPVDAKMVINAFNSGADSYMTDFEDSNSPLWTNQIQGQINIGQAIRRTLSFEQSSPAGTKSYKLNDKIATLQVRPRGWHLDEKHVTIDGQRVAGGIFDFALFMFHNAKELLARGAGPYFYLPKLESHLEARLWNEIFVMTQNELGLPQGTIKATVLIETILAAFEMDEILYELREHSAGLNAGRWDYIFSCIKKFSRDREFCLADRAKVTMTAPFMRAYALLLLKTCHRRGAPAIGGMSALIPIKNDPVKNEAAMAGIIADKRRDATDGYDGGWVAHPGLVEASMKEFVDVLGDRPNQFEKQKPEVEVTAAQLLDFKPEQPITEAGLRMNINVGIHYLGAWLAGNGCVPIHNLMEDAATAEISRSQVWQWIRSPKGVLDDGRKVTADLVRRLVPRSSPRSRRAASSASSTAPPRSSRR
jgi:malate synthase